MSDDRAAIRELLQALDLGLDVLHQHVDIIDRKIDTLEARFARIERRLEDLIERDRSPQDAGAHTALRPRRPAGRGSW